MQRGHFVKDFNFADSYSQLRGFDTLGDFVPFYKRDNVCYYVQFVYMHKTLLLKKMYFIRKSVAFCGSEFLSN